jgi:serine kinase of HPr protein (carbohydrate metabolism regulator)
MTADTAALDQASRGRAIHATAVLVGEAGIVIRGRSGAGKSSLAVALIESARSHGLFARLVGDDRVYVALRNGRLMVSAHPAIAGKIERRGAGIFEVPHEGKAVVRLIVDLLDAEPGCGIEPRLPSPADRVTTVESANVPRVTLRAGEPAAELAAQILLELPLSRTWE